MKFLVSPITYPRENDRLSAFHPIPSLQGPILISHMRPTGKTIGACSEIVRGDELTTEENQVKEAKSLAPLKESFR